MDKNYILNVWVQIHGLRVQIHELQVQIHKSRVQIHQLRVQIHEFKNHWINENSRDFKQAFV